MTKIKNLAIFNWFLIILILITLQTFFSSCKKAKNNNSNNTYHKKNKQTIIFKELGFAVEVPSEFENIDEETLRMAKNRVKDKKQISIFDVKLIDSFYGKLNDFLNISALTPKSSIDADILKYVSDLKNYFEPDYEVKQNNIYSNGGFNVIILQIANEKVYIVKTLYYNSSEGIFQIDYIVPSKFLTPGLLKKVEDMLLSVTQIQS